jgi:hypothetical protein
MNNNLSERILATESTDRWQPIVQIIAGVPNIV